MQPYQDCLDEDFCHAKDHLQGLIEDIYQTGNIADLEFHLDEVCSYFDVAIPKEKPALAKPPTESQKQTERMLQNWMGYTRAHAEMACGSTRKEVVR